MVTVGLVVLGSALVVSTMYGLLHQPWSGAVREVDATQDDRPRLDAVALGGPLGRRATLVQFSTAFCAPCRATRQILGDVADLVDGVTHVEIDAEAHLDLVRRLDVRRTPTVLVLDGDGRVVRRASGQPRKADVVAALEFLG